MKSTEMTSGQKSEKRVGVDSADGDPSKQASTEDNSATMMNTPGLKPRGFRADQLIEMAGDDGYRLGTEAPRKDKIKG